MTAAPSDMPPREQRPAAVPGVSARGALIGLVVVAGAMDFLFFPLCRACESTSGIVAMLVIGSLAPAFIGGQVGALAIWLVFGEAPFRRRLIMHWGIATGLGTALLLGLVATWPDPLSSAAINAILCSAGPSACALPAASLAAQLPLWPLRSYLGWRVEPRSAEMVFVNQPLSIQDIFSGTAVVGLTLGLARMTDTLIPREDAYPFANAWEELALFAGAAFAMSLLVSVPVVVFVLRAKKLATGFVAMSVYLFLGLLLLVGIPFVVSHAAPDFEAIAMLLIGTFALAAALAAPLLALRSCGYRLAWPRDRRQAAFDLPAR